MKSSPIWKLNRKTQSFSAKAFGHTAMLVPEGEDGFNIVDDGFPVYMEPTLYKAKRWAENNLPYLSSSRKLILCSEWNRIIGELTRQLKPRGFTIRVQDYPGNDLLSFLVEELHQK